jgi:hypothetical protein
MSAWIRHSVWFSRLVLAGSVLLMTRVGMSSILDPVGSATRHGMTLGSPDAITVMRVEGGVFVGIAAALVACLIAEARLLAGLALLAIVIVAVTAVRLLGLALDGPGPFTLMVLKPEVALSVLSTLGVALEWRRSRNPESHPSTSGASIGGGAGIARG